MSFDRWLSIAQAASYLGVSVRTIRRYTDDGWFAFVSTPGHTARVAQSIVSRRFFEDGPQPYAAAIPQVLAYPGPLNDEMQIPHGEAEIRAFLALLAKKLDELRPLS